MSTQLYTAEFVSPGHPDKICDYIADVILDAYRAKDPHTRGAIEVMGGHGVIKINGEIRSDAVVDIDEIVSNIVGPEMDRIIAVAKQSTQIARGVDTGGAGDQGIMIGYACSDTPNHMPYEYELARGLCQHIYKEFPFDGKTQVTVERDGSVWTIKTVVASFQNAPQQRLLELAQEFIPNAERYIINPAGDWDIGGFEADAGLTGRKIVVDAYGPRVPVGGGAFSGKDHTKVDRSGAYMARKIAVDMLRKHNAKEVMVKLAYAIGERDPVKAIAVIDGVEEVLSGHDLSPQGIFDALHLADMSYADTARWGHFGRGLFSDDDST